MRSAPKTKNIGQLIPKASIRPNFAATSDSNSGIDLAMSTNNVYQTGVWVKILLQQPLG